MTVEENIKNYKVRIKAVEREIRNEPNNKKKARLNKYKQRLEIDLRDYIRFQKGA